MKKLTALVLALVMCFGLVACGSTPAPSSTPASESTSQAETTNENFVDPVNGWDVYDELIDEVFEVGPTAIPVCFRNSAAVYRTEISGVAPSFAGPYQFRDVTVSN